MMIGGIARFFKLAQIKDVVDLDDPSTTALHAAIIHEKPFLKNLYIDFYHRVSAMLARQEVREAIIQLGVAPDEAQQRVLALSPEELVLVEEQLDSLPAGGNAILVVLGIVFLVLLVLELTGTIDIFKKT